MYVLRNTVGNEILEMSSDAAKVVETALQSLEEPVHFYGLEMHLKICFEA